MSPHCKDFMFSLLYSQLRLCPHKCRKGFKEKSKFHPCTVSYYAPWEAINKSVSKLFLYSSRNLTCMLYICEFLHKWEDTRHFCIYIIYIFFANLIIRKQIFIYISLMSKADCFIIYLSYLYFFYLELSISNLCSFFY